MPYRRLIMTAVLTGMAATIAYGFAPFTLFGLYHIYEPVLLWRNLEFVVFVAIMTYGVVEFGLALRVVLRWMRQVSVKRRGFRGGVSASGAPPWA
ncbi:MAG: hypothetical protein ACE5LU_25405 [Anaerolineae bacterium]